LALFGLPGWLSAQRVSHPCPRTLPPARPRPRYGCCFRPTGRAGAWGVCRPNPYLFRIAPLCPLSVQTISPFDLSPRHPSFLCSEGLQEWRKTVKTSAAAGRGRGVRTAVRRGRNTPSFDLQRRFFQFFSPAHSPKPFLRKRMQRNLPPPVPLMEAARGPHSPLYPCHPSRLMKSDRSPRVEAEKHFPRISALCLRQSVEF